MEDLKTLRIGTILDQDYGMFGLEYDNTLGKKNMMRLDATSYDRALREAKSFLGISENDHDSDGNPWVIE